MVLRLPFVSRSTGVTITRGAWRCLTAASLLSATTAAALGLPPDTLAGSATAAAGGVPSRLAPDTLNRRVFNVRGPAQRYELGTHGTFEYRRPVRLRMAREIPATVAGTFALGLRPGSLPEWGATAVSTLALYANQDV